MRDLGDGFVLDQFSRKHVTPENIAAMGDLLDHLTDGRKKKISREDLQSTISQKSFYLSAVFKDDKLVGMASVHIHLKPCRFMIAYVDDVVVAPGAQGRGLSRHLMNDLIDRARLWGALWIDLTSAPQRVAANSLYQKLGFARRNVSAFRLPVPPLIGKPRVLSFDSTTAQNAQAVSAVYIHSLRTLMGRKAFASSEIFAEILTEATPGDLLAAAMMLKVRELNVFTPPAFDGTQLTELGFEKRDTNVYRLTL